MVRREMLILISPLDLCLIFEDECGRYECRGRFISIWSRVWRVKDYWRGLLVSPDAIGKRTMAAVVGWGVRV